LRYQSRELILKTSVTKGRSCGICGRQTSTGAGFLRIRRLSLPIRTPPIAPQ
jgi:hypothetical protein